jgi:hypothetical protein
MPDLRFLLLRLVPTLVVLAVVATLAVSATVAFRSAAPPAGDATDPCALDAASVRASVPASDPAPGPAQCVNPTATLAPGEQADVALLLGGTTAPVSSAALIPLDSGVATPPPPRLVGPAIRIDPATAEGAYRLHVLLSNGDLEVLDLRIAAPAPAS